MTLLTEEGAVLLKNCFLLIEYFIKIMQDRSGSQKNKYVTDFELRIEKYFRSFNFCLIVDYRYLYG